jgi:uncharacterized Zn-finger protein
MPLGANRDNWLEYACNGEPKCPHCDHVCEVSENEWWKLYDNDSGDHEVTCPRCHKDFTVHVHCEFSFSTDEQPEPEDTAENRGTAR